MTNIIVDLFILPTSLNSRLDRLRFMLRLKVFNLTFSDDTIFVRIYDDRESQWITVIFPHCARWKHAIFPEPFIINSVIDLHFTYPNSRSRSTFSSWIFMNFSSLRLAPSSGFVITISRSVLNGWELFVVVELTLSTIVGRQAGGDWWWIRARRRWEGGIKANYWTCQTCQSESQCWKRKKSYGLGLDLIISEPERMSTAKWCAVI